jgi:hypothetical protein
MGGSPMGSGSAGGAISSGGATMPCEVGAVVASKCGLCHGAQPLAGAPMSLSTLADFQRDYTVQSTPQLAGRTLRMYELARIRVNREMGTTPMPQGSPLAPADLATLDGWLRAGAPAGASCAGTTDQGAAGSGGAGRPTGGVAPGMGNDNAGGAAGAGTDTGVAGSGGMQAGSVTPGGRLVTDECEDAAAAFEPLEPRAGETCYEFLVHGASSATDTSKFEIQLGESCNQFYYSIPWPRGTVATRFGARYDNLPVLHHWLGFTSSAPTAAGSVVRNVTGTTIGENAELVGGWAVGGCNTEFDDDIGLRLPDSGRIMIQWHHYNHTGSPQRDGSAVQWCTVPASAREHIAGLTFLGTENFHGLLGMPPGVESEFTTSCWNTTSSPITIAGFTPHMHEIGINMRSVLEREGDSPEMVFDEAFIFDSQVNYRVNPRIVLQPGDAITTTCTFRNTTPFNVAFGQATGQEMCYQFALSYPYGALNNGVFSLFGATNTCW